MDDEEGLNDEGEVANPNDSYLVDLDGDGRDELFGFWIGTYEGRILEKYIPGYVAPAGNGAFDMSRGGWPDGGLDSDNDFLSDNFEDANSDFDEQIDDDGNLQLVKTGMDSESYDSDFDHIPDGVEVLYLDRLARRLRLPRFDPLDQSDGLGNPDRDGYQNWEEILRGTDPLTPDDEPVEVDENDNPDASSSDNTSGAVISSGFTTVADPVGGGYSVNDGVIPGLTQLEFGTTSHLYGSGEWPQGLPNDGVAEIPITAKPDFFMEYRGGSAIWHRKQRISDGDPELGIEPSFTSEYALGQNWLENTVSAYFVDAGADAKVLSAMESYASSGEYITTAGIPRFWNGSDSYFPYSSLEEHDVFFDTFVSEVRFRSEIPVAKKQVFFFKALETVDALGTGVVNPPTESLVTVTFEVGDVTASIKKTGGTAISVAGPNLAFSCVTSAGMHSTASLEGLPVELTADTDRNGAIDADDEADKDQFTNERGAVYLVNYDHDEARDGGKQEDALKWSAVSDGNDDGVPKFKLRPDGEEWAVDPAKEDDLTELELTIPDLPGDNSVFLKVKDDHPDDAKAFHLYLARYNDEGEVAEYIPLWGGFNFDENEPSGVVTFKSPDADTGKWTEVNISKWVNKNHPDYDETRANPKNDKYKLFLEGTIFRGMPIPRDDGFGKYDGSSTIFDGDIEIGLEIREDDAPLGEPSWVKLSHCGVEPDEPDKVLAFEGHDDAYTAQGFGKYAKGGRYGHVYIVTSTDDSGGDPDPSTLRYAIESPVPRTIIFALETEDGTIELDKPLTVRHPRLTIAGETAFQNGSSGICLKDAGLKIEADDVIVRYIRSRPGEKAGGNADAISISKGASRVIVDHCSTSFSTDGLIDVSDKSKRGVHVTVQNCIMAWPLDKSIHWEFNNGDRSHEHHGKIWEEVNGPGFAHPNPESPPANWHHEEHAFASLIRAGYGARITLWSNFYAHARGRCARPGTWETAEDDPDGMQFDFVNNIIYGWGDKDSEKVATYAGEGNEVDDEESDGGLGRFNIINNHYRARLGFEDEDEKYAFRARNPAERAFIDGNWMHILVEDFIPLNDQDSIPENQYEPNVLKFDSNQFGTAEKKEAFKSVRFDSGDYALPIRATEANQEQARAIVGANLKRDALDEQLIGSNGQGGEYKNHGGTIINQSLNWPPLEVAVSLPDADEDGIPDTKEPIEPTNRNTAWAHDPRNAQLHPAVGNGHHTQLEKYLFELVEELAPEIPD